MMEGVKRKYNHPRLVDRLWIDRAKITSSHRDELILPYMGPPEERSHELLHSVI